MDPQPNSPDTLGTSSQPETSHCPVCATTKLISSIHTKHLSLVVCTSCGHRLALHSEASSDLTWEPSFATLATSELRVRQARLIFGRLEAYLPRGGKILDCGAGDGLFLQTARDFGHFDLAGIDARHDSIESMKLLGYEAALAPPPPITGDSIRAVCLREFTFRPRVITWLDVIDRFPPNDRFQLVDETLKGLPEVEFLVVKLPMADGFLHRVAEMLARLGSKKMLDRIFEAHSPAPRVHAFTRQSARLAISQWGLSVIDEIGDHDFETPTIARRLSKSFLLRYLPSYASDFLSNTLKYVIQRTALFDSRIYICRRGTTAVQTP